MNYLHDAAAILRDQRLGELLATIGEWNASIGKERERHRADAIWLLKEWKRRYTIPERAAFELAVAQRKMGSKHGP
jgi:predicted HD phosphohydrolase